MASPTARSSLLGRNPSRKKTLAGGVGGGARSRKPAPASTPTFDRLFSSAGDSPRSTASGGSAGSVSTLGYGSAHAGVPTPSTGYVSSDGRTSPSFFACEEDGLNAGEYTPLADAGGAVSVQPRRLGFDSRQPDRAVVIAVGQHGVATHEPAYHRSLLEDFDSTEKAVPGSSRQLHAVTGGSGGGGGGDGGIPTGKIVAHPNQNATDKDPRFHPDAPATKSVILCVVPLFMGYACLFSLQHKITGVYGIQDSGERFDQFGNAVSFLYIGNLVFRFAHNVMFACITPRARVIVAITSMMISLSLLLFGVFFFKQTQTLAWVYGAYALGGVAVGSFEANVLSAITPLGHQTKLWATLGIPIGVSSITIGAFGVMAAGASPEVIYGTTIAALACSLFVWTCIVPYHHVAGNSDSVSAFWGSLKDYAKWLPKIKWHAVCLAIDMACVSTFSPGVMLYVFDSPAGVPLFGPNGTRVNHDAFFCVYNLFTFLGETISRKFAYVDKKERSPWWFLLFSLIGIVMNVAGALYSIGIVCPLAGMFVFLANGSIYNRTTKYVDNHVDPIFNLTALSAWLFVGDLGSVLGSNMTPYVRQWLG
eukprot:g3127.t1